MKKIILLVACVCFHFLHAQTKEGIKVTLSFQNSSKIQVINLFEKETGYQFYFIEDWIDEKPISGSYSNTLLSTILTTVFKDTFINFYLSKFIVDF